MSNKKLGTDFERRVCEELAYRGYWVHFLAPDARGAQPFDIIAAQDGVVLAVECKTLLGGQRYFPASRFEDNQWLAFDTWMKRGNGTPVIIVDRGKKGAVWFLYNPNAERYDLDDAAIFSFTMTESE